MSNCNGPVVCELLDDQRHAACLSKFDRVRAKIGQHLHKSTRNSIVTETFARIRCGRCSDMCGILAAALPTHLLEAALVTDDILLLPRSRPAPCTLLPQSGQRPDALLVCPLRFPGARLVHLLTAPRPFLAAFLLLLLLSVAGIMHPNCTDTI